MIYWYFVSLIAFFLYICLNTSLVFSAGCDLKRHSKPVSLFFLVCSVQEVIENNGQITIITHQKDEREITIDEYNTLISLDAATHWPAHCPTGTAWNHFSISRGRPNTKIHEKQGECLVSEDEGGSMLHIRHRQPDGQMAIREIDTNKHKPIRKGNEILSFEPPVPGMNISNGYWAE